MENVMAPLPNPNSAEERKAEGYKDKYEHGDKNVLDTINPTAAKDIKSTKSNWSCLQNNNSAS